MAIVIPAELRALATLHAGRIAAALGPLRSGAAFVAPAERFVFLCFTNRCGSNYLAQLLASTGAFNEAGEYFNAETVLEHARAAGLGSLGAYVRHLPRLVAHGGRVVAKAAIDQLIMLADAGILEPCLDGAVFVLLERGDRVGQAISRVIASQNGRWTTAHASAVDDSALCYDGAAIADQLDKIALANAAFYRFFAANGIVPVHLAYEAVLADPQGAITAIGERAGVAGLRVDPARVTIGRQAGAVSAAWRERFLARARCSELSRRATMEQRAHQSLPSSPERQ